jgi:hypothetical protein
VTDSHLSELTWAGPLSIIEKMSKLIPANYNFEVINNNDNSKLIIYVTDSTLESIRTKVDNLLEILSDQDQ